MGSTPLPSILLSVFLLAGCAGSVAIVDKHGVANDVADVVEIANDDVPNDAQHIDRQPLNRSVASIPLPVPIIVNDHTQRKLTASSHSRIQPAAVAQRSKPDHVLDQLSAANFKFNVSQTQVQVDDRVHVELAIFPQSQQINIHDELTKISGSILVSKVVTVHLTTSDGLTVNNNMIPSSQALDSSEPTTWAWDVTAKHPGNQTMTITVNALVTVDDSKAERHIKTFSSTVAVIITPKQQLKKWFDEYWKWAWTTLLVPLLSWVWKRIKSR